MYRLNPLLLLLFIGMTSCTTYNYVRLDSDLPQKAEGEQYYYDSEDIFIAYDFNGDAMPIFLYMENTGNRDVYLDLSRSMFLENDQIVKDLMIEEKTTTIGVDPYYGSWVEYGTRQRSKEVVLIPPGKILKLKYQPYLVSFDNARKQTGTQRLIKSPESGAYMSYKETQSPPSRSFEIRLVFANDRDFRDEWIIASHFDADRMFYTEAPPNAFVGGKNANMFYTSQTKGTGVFGAILGGLLLVLFFATVAD